MEERQYVCDYVVEPASRLYEEGEKPRCCAGRWLEVDGGGYFLKECSVKLRAGETCYYKEKCACAKSDKLYCSVECCYPYTCRNCHRRSCKDCYIANANDRCAYCVYLCDECDCLGFDADDWPTTKHDESCPLHTSSSESDDDEDDDEQPYAHATLGEDSPTVGKEWP